MTESTSHPAVGIDLGTSRSSISTSAGQRHMVESYVGWPVDMVARKVLKRPVLVGKQALVSMPAIYQIFIFLYQMIQLMDMFL